MKNIKQLLLLSLLLYIENECFFFVCQAKNSGEK
jgi:hypothetical protein